MILVMRVKEDLQLMAKMASQAHPAQTVRRVFQVTPRMALQESQGTGDCQDSLGHREPGVIQAFLDFKVWASVYETLLHVQRTQSEQRCSWFRENFLSLRSIMVTVNSTPCFYIYIFLFAAVMSPQHHVLPTP